MGETVLVAMSGGVDSSVAALLVRQAGYAPVGVTLALHAGGEAPAAPGQKTRCSSDAAADARQVADRLGIPFHVFDFQEAFQREVQARFAAAYRRGETPNPCIDCNRYIKFGGLFRRSEEMGISHLATGHYARVAFDGASGRWLLKKGLDEGKDQSYVLYTLTQDQLSRLLLPLGELAKKEVRRLAEENGFLNAEKPDSQDICFVPDGDYAGFIRRYTGEESLPGPFVDAEGTVLGQHRGVIHYTVGQRKGLGLSFPQPMYVCRVEPEENRVVLGKHEELFSDTLIARDLNLIARETLEKPVRVSAKIRYRHAEQPAVAVQTGPDELRVVFDEPQRAITPGQSVVLYDGDTVVGGGVITRKQGGT